MQLGELIKSARNRKGMSIQEAHLQSGLNMNSLQKYERAGTETGAVPPVDKLAQLCVLYDIDPREALSAAASNELDTTKFYSAAERQKAANDLIGETREKLKRYGFSARTYDDYVSSRGITAEENDLDYPLGLVSLEALNIAVGVKGIEARSLPTELKNLEQELSLLEYEQLYTLYERISPEPLYILEEPISFCDELFGDLRARDAYCDKMISFLLTTTIYSGFFFFLDKASQEKLLAETGCSQENGASIWAKREALFHVCESLIKRIKERNPIRLFDHKEYCWTRNPYEWEVESGSVVLPEGESIDDIRTCYRLINENGQIADLWDNVKAGSKY